MTVAARWRCSGSEEAAAMSGQGVWLRARARLRRFPVLLAGCGEQAAAYGRCVAAAAGGTAELRRDACLEEFRALRDCFDRAAKATPK